MARTTSVLTCNSCTSSMKSGYSSICRVTHCCRLKISAWIPGEQSSKSNYLQTVYAWKSKWVICEVIQGMDVGVNSRVSRNYWPIQSSSVREAS